MPPRCLVLLLLGGAIGMLPTSLNAQRLTGHVLEEGTLAPISAADITILDRSGREIRSSVTDSAGWFLFEIATSGAYTLRVKHIAFADYSTDRIDIARGETVEVQVRMGRTIIPLEPLIVTARNEGIGRLAEFHQRLETNAFGRFIAREEIEARRLARVSDLLRTQAGVRIVSARRGPVDSRIITMRGGCQPTLYIDGARVRQSYDAPIDDLLVPDMLEGVEIYPSSAGAPAQYQAASGCGVVLFWTRQGEPGAPFSWKRVIAGVAVVGLILFLAR